MAIEGSTLANIDYVVKSRYSTMKMWNLAAREHPLFARVRKSGKFTGKDIIHPVQYGNPQGISNTFGTAKTSAGPHKGIKWTLTRARKYGYHELDGEAIHATSDDAGAFVREIRHAIDTLLTSWGDDAGIELYSDGANDLGQVSSVSVNVITFTVADDAAKFEVDMVIDSNTARTGAGTPHSSPKIIAVDEDAGTIEVDAIGTIVASDFLFRAGNRDLGVKGLSVWYPQVAPTGGDSHFGVDRSVHVTRLAGHRLDGTGMDLDEGLLELASKIHRKKGRPTEVYMNTTNWNNLNLKLGAKVQRDQDEKTANFGFRFIEMSTAAGVLKVFPDPDAPPDKAYMLDMRSLVIKHLKALPHTISDDGNTFLRLTDDDGVEFRARGWWQLVDGAPGHSGVLFGL